MLKMFSFHELWHAYVMVPFWCLPSANISLLAGIVNFQPRLVRLSRPKMDRKFLLTVSKWNADAGSRELDNSPGYQCCNGASIAASLKVWAQ
jgi:hypothetical protein